MATKNKLAKKQPARSIVIPKTEAEILHNWDRDTAIASFTPAEKEAYDEYARLYDLQRERDLNWRYSVGHHTASVYRASRKEQGNTSRGTPRKNLWQANLFPRMAVALGISNSKILYGMMKLAEVWESPAVFRKDIVEREGSTGYRLAWSHAIYLAEVPDDEQREDLLIRCLEGCWTSRQLLEAIYKEIEGRGVRSPSSRDGIPRTAKECLRNAAEMTRKMLNKYEYAWLGTQFDLREAFAETDASKLEKGDLTLMRDLSEDLQRLADYSDEMREILADLTIIVDGKMAKQLEHDKMAADAEVKEDAEEAEEPEEQCEPADGGDDKPINMAKHQREQRAATKQRGKRKKKTDQPPPAPRF